MRQSTNNSVNFKYPDEIGFAFNAVLVVVEGEGVTSITIKIDSDGKTTQQISFDAFNGKVYGDIRSFIQTMFDENLTSVDYKEGFEKSSMGRSVNVTVTAYEQDRPLSEISFSTFFVWAALVVGETYNGFRTLTCFRGFPFSIDVYSDLEGSIKLENDQGYSSDVQIPEKGIYNVMLPNDLANSYTLYDTSGILAETTFDKTFDFTFLKVVSIGSKKRAVINIVDGCDDGVYLRWVDRHGHICYWLFEKGAEKFTIDEGGRFLRNNLLDWDQQYGYSGAATRRQSYTRQDTIPLCAPLVSRETWDFLLGISSSPIVDMFIGYDSNDNPRWQSVVVQAGSYTKEMRTPLIDFTITISIPETPLQNL